MGTVVGAIASGRVPVGNAAGDPVTSWLNAVSILSGCCSWPPARTWRPCSWSATRAARATPDLERYFATRALVAAVAAGAIAVAGIFVFRADARYIYDGLTATRCRW